MVSPHPVAVLRCVTYVAQGQVIAREVPGVERGIETFWRSRIWPESQCHTHKCIQMPSEGGLADDSIRLCGTI